MARLIQPLNRYVTVFKMVFWDFFLPLWLKCRDLINEFRQYRLQLYSDCNYRCLDCGWWNQRQAVVMTVNPTSFDYIVRHSIVNVFGGDPVIHAQFQHVLNALRRRSLRIRLWSTGIGNLDRWLAIVVLLDRLYLYVPSGDPEQYQALVGTYTWAQLLAQIKQLSSVSSNIWLNYEARADTIQFLPELYELAYDHGCGLLIQCDRSKFFDRESLLCLKRFYRVPNVDVYFTGKLNTATRCSGVSAVVTNGGWQLLKNKAYALINRIV